MPWPLFTLCQVGFSLSAFTLHHRLGKLFIMLPSRRKENSELQWESPPFVLVTSGIEVTIVTESPFRYF